MNGVVFKQRYKSVNISTTPTLNRKHLVYIATRKGAIHNPGCGFGLWGRLPGMEGSENIDSLQKAKRTVTEVSKRRTIYRAILSVDSETGKQHDLYRRETWQKLIDRKISVLATQMGIDRKDFCWCASMHYTKGHPHVHIMYWDNSDKVRQEFVPPERFEIIAEKVRAEFGREIYQEELKEFQEAKRGIVSQVRLELQSMCREANLADALNLNNISNAKLDELGRAFAELAVKLPSHGALKYAYLPQAYQEQLNRVLEQILGVTDFQRLEKRYLKLTDEISQLYGNGEEKKAYNREKALEALYKGMGNTVLSVLKEYKAGLELSAPTGHEELLTLMRNGGRPLISTFQSYRALLDLFPKERTPIGVLMAQKDFRSALARAGAEFCGDFRVRAMADGYIKAVSARDGLEEKELRKEVYRELRHVAREMILEQAQEDAGYREQFARDTVAMLLLRLFRDHSQGANQAQSQRDLLLARRRELSETALLDRKKQREQAGNWSQEF